MKQAREQFYHIPVMVDEVVRFIDPQPSGVYVDATFGSGGHTRALLIKEPQCRVIAIDWDRTALDVHQALFEQEFPGRVHFIWGNFAQLLHLLKKNKISQVNGIVADFGTSLAQLKQRPGFSFATDTPLDMRMSPAHQSVTAREILNYASEEELATIFFRYGEEKKSRALARALVAARKKKPLETTGDVVKVVTVLIPAHAGRRIHPATKIFQALRIAVNKELDNIKSLLASVLRVLAPGGRLVCISFHSLEDRLVKQFLHEHQHEFNLLTARAVSPSAQEIVRNPSARSAKLRAAERKNVV